MGRASKIECFFGTVGWVLLLLSMLAVSASHGGVEGEQPTNEDKLFSYGLIGLMIAIAILGAFVYEMCGE